MLGLTLSTSNRVASVQSEPGQQNLLLQQPLGRKRGLRQVRPWEVNRPFLLFDFFFVVVFSSFVCFEIISACNISLLWIMSYSG